MDMKYWDKLVQTANYLRNQSPVSFIGMTSYETGTGIKLELKHFQVISITDFAMDWKPQTGFKKFQPRSTLCILAEYEDNHIYWMLDSTKKVIRVSNVKWNKKKRLADTTPGDEPCSKRACIQEPD